MFAALRHALAAATEDAPLVLTANRRLARVLADEYGRWQVESGRSAWRSPPVMALKDWLYTLPDVVAATGPVPVRINTHHSEVLWERCLRRELDSEIGGMGNLVQLARDAHQRMADACVDIRTVARSARTTDERFFAAAAGRYIAILEREGWIDAAGLAAQAVTLIRDSDSGLHARYLLAGFDRETAQLAEICGALRQCGKTVEFLQPAQIAGNRRVCSFADSDSELRAAGAWARQRLEAQPTSRIAIIRQGLALTADMDVRRVREGAMPGWQLGGGSARSVVNVSYGRRLTEFPLIAVAFLVLRWLVSDRPSRDIAMLLTSLHIGGSEISGRARLELKLRDLPDREWSPAMLGAALRQKAADGDATDWLTAVARLSKWRHDLPGRATAAEWAIHIDAVLDSVGWGGDESLDSDSYQLVNRWRELLNEFARLDLVSRAMSKAEAFGRLERMAADTLFQPESDAAPIQLMGPLEAAGLEFDALWVSGMTAEAWPPAGTPSALLSRQLQRDASMPDATPEDTLTYATTIVQRLIHSAPDVVCSWPRLEQDAEQVLTPLLSAIAPAESPPCEDPGWFASGLANGEIADNCEDAVPAVDGDRVYGGAATIERQMSEPFSAFASGRLACSPLYRQAVGIPAALRGSVVHDTLYRLYQGKPSRRDVETWCKSDIDARVAEAAGGAMARHLQNTDDVLAALLRLELPRIERLVTGFVRIDAERPDFAVSAVEGELQLQHAGLVLNLRFDRIDAYPDGQIAILDYKTGRTRQLQKKNGEVEEPQLFVYALAAEQPVAGIALVNIDSRETSLSGAGREFSDWQAWTEVCETMADEIRAACNDLVAGDVRIVADQGVAKARPLNLLTRYTELRDGSD